MTESNTEVLIEKEEKDKTEIKIVINTTRVEERAAVQKETEINSKVVKDKEVDHSVETEVTTEIHVIVCEVEIFIMVFDYKGA